MSETDPRGQRTPMAEKHSGPTDEPRTPTEMDTANSARGRAKTASLISDLIQVRNFQRSSNVLPGVGVAKNRKDPTHRPADLVAQDETANALVEKIAAEELSIGAIAMLWSKEIGAIAMLWSKESGHSVSEVATELLTAFQERLKECSMEMSKDATLSRQELLKFCEDAGIDAPRFWARVA